MKKCLLFFISAFTSMIVFAQEYVPPTNDYVWSTITNINFLAQYRMGEEGLFHYYETKSIDSFSNEHAQYSRAIKGTKHFYCYDNDNNIFYYYTDNTIGFYNPNQINYINFIRNCMKRANVKKVKEKEAIFLTENVLKGMKERYRRKNDSISECKRIEREKFVRDSIETAQRKEKEQEEYRKSHDWGDLSMSKSYELKCEFCDISHRVKDYSVLSISADTLYYLLDEPDMSYLGINNVWVHYSILTRDFKNDERFRDYINIWQDSIANNNRFNNQRVSVFNIIQYNKFKDKIYSIAPNGFLQRWGWELNSAQGIEPFFCFFNSSKKTIKYVDLYFSIYNDVGDRCYLKYERSYIGKVRGVGPVEPFEAGSWYWDRATHYTSGDASEMRIVKLVITYMDGTTKTLPKSSIIYEKM